MGVEGEGAGDGEGTLVFSNFSVGRGVILCDFLMTLIFLHNLIDMGVVMFENNGVQTFQSLDSHFGFPLAQSLFCNTSP